MGDYFDQLAKAAFHPPGIHAGDHAPRKERMKETIPIAALAKAIETVSSAPFASVAVITKTEDILGKDRQWTPADNPAAKHFFDQLPTYRKQHSTVDSFTAAVVEKGGVSEVNRFLKERGFALELVDPNNPHAVAAASVFDLKVLWKSPGTYYPVNLAKDGSMVPGVWIEKVRGFYESPGRTYPIVELETQSGERFFATRYDEPLDSADPLAASDAARKLAKERKPLSGEKYPNGVQFPMVDYERSGDMDWMLGAKTVDEQGAEYVIGTAKFVHRFRLNEMGARAEAANAVVAMRAAPVALVIDGPYLAWFEVGETLPFAILVTEAEMKQPAGLGS